MGKIDAHCDRGRRQNKQRMTVKWEKEKRHLNSDERATHQKKKKRNQRNKPEQNKAK